MCIDLLHGDSVITGILPTCLPGKCQLHAAWDSEKGKTSSPENFFSIYKSQYTLISHYNHHVICIQNNWLKLLDYTPQKLLLSLDHFLIVISNW